jgi:hypothetical protein
MSGPFKMKGFPAQAGVSPVTKKTDPKKLTADSVSDLKGAGKKGGEEHFLQLDAAKNAQEVRSDVNKGGDALTILSKKYGGKWSREAIKNKDGSSRSKFVNSKGQSVSEVENNLLNSKADAMGD